MDRKKRQCKWLAGLILVFLSISFLGDFTAHAESMLTPSSGNDTIVTVTPGTSTHVNVPIKSIYASLDLYSLTAESSSALMKISNVRLVETSSGKSVSLANGVSISTTAHYAIDFDITADEALKIGYNTIKFKGQAYNYSDEEVEGTREYELLTVTTYTETELDPAYLVISDISYTKSKLRVGSSLTLSLTVKNEGAVSAVNAYLSIDYGESGIVPDYSVAKIKVGTLKPGESKAVSAAIKIPNTVTPGNVSVTASLTCKDKAGAELGPFTQTLYFDIAKAATPSTKGPVIKVGTKSNYKEVKPGKSYTLVLRVRNAGDETAKNVKLACTAGLGAESGITKNFTTDAISVGTIKSGITEKVQVPVVVAENVTAGIKELTFTASYTDANGNAKTDVTMTMYLNVAATEVNNTSNLEVHHVSQSIASPVAGQQFSISFQVTNSGASDVSDLHLTGQNFGATNFEPVSSDPYVNIGTLPAGATKNISVAMKCGEDITSGMNPLAYAMEYVDANGEKHADPVTLYVLNVQSKDAAIGKPKLIVSAYETDREILKAADTFLFTFTLKNTHTLKAAKNIKITITQADGIFSAASGTNIFYIDAIAAGEEAVQSMELKTKADAATGDYDLKILVEYEYDEMSDADKEKGGVSEENIIKLHATENYRPVIENISIDAWDGIYVDTPVDLSFEFYNMGKSKLGNVYVTVEGDFALANNSNMSYVGAVESYGQEYISPSVVALKAGDATGILTVHFEDSNGDEVTVSQEFTEFVQEYGTGGMDDGMDFVDIPDGYYMNENGEIVPIDNGSGGMKPWLWILIAAAAASVITVIVLVVRNAGKKKQQKTLIEDDDDEDY